LSGPDSIRSGCRSYSGASVGLDDTGLDDTGLGDAGLGATRPGTAGFGAAGLDAAEIGASLRWTATFVPQLGQKAASASSKVPQFVQ